MSWRKHSLFIATTLLMSVLLLLDYGSIGTTYDETADLRIAGELRAGKSPFANIEIPSQTRLIYYLHAVATSVFDDALTHYTISALGVVLLLWVWYFFLYRYAGKQAAHILLFLALTSIPLLTAGRHLLTHSNAVFALFFSLTFIQFYHWIATKKQWHLILSAMFAGLSTALSLLGVFAIFPLLGVAIFCRKHITWKAPLILLSVLTALVTFFSVTIIYLNPEVLSTAIHEALDGHTYSYWNYLNTGQVHAPFYFSWVLFITKIHPAIAILFFYSWLLLWRSENLQHRFMAGLCTGTFVFLWVKSGVFHYDAPHHQIGFIPLVYGAISVAGAGLMSAFQKKILTAAGCAFCIHQLVLIFQCFPNFLFYGAHYGESFIGQFYGPAVVHGLGVNELHNDIHRLLETQPHALVLKQDHSATRLSGERFINFAPGDTATFCEYAVSSFLDIHHLQYENNKAFDTLLQQKYRVIKTWYYPWGIPMYTLHQHR